MMSRNLYNCVRVCMGSQPCLRRLMSTRTKAVELELFQSALPKVIDILGKCKKFEPLPEMKETLEKIITSNVEGGKKQRGMTTVLAYEMFEKPEKITEESLELARIMGWCVEMMQAFFIMLDDIMDGSVTRRGSPCWYTQPAVGMRAVNDALLIKCSYTEIIKLCCGDKPYYHNLKELFDSIVFHTSIGQHIDYMTATKKKDFSLFTMKRYQAIIKHKTAYYSYTLPTSIGLTLTNNTDPRAHKIIENISTDIGSFFQVQDDFIDVFGDPQRTGKQGTDICEGKCTWLAVTALQRCTDAQRIVFNTCYGSREPAHQERIMQLFEELDLRNVYRNHQEREYHRISQEADKLPKELSPPLFIMLLNRINNRQF